MNIDKRYKDALYHACSFIDDRRYLKMIFFVKVKYSLSLENPRSFNEKLQWLKLNDRNNSYPDLVDKYRVREFVAERIGDDYLIPLVGLWDTVDEVDFGSLPDRFVAKCTHDSGSVVICADKESFDEDVAKKKLSHALRHNMFFAGREWPYSKVKPRIIIEEYLGDPSDDLIDYKFMCFGGKVKCIFTCTERFSGEGLRVTFFDTDWKKLPFERHYPASDKAIPEPENLSEMIRIAESLSKGLVFARIDLYVSDNSIYFGEVTLYPGSGFEPFRPIEWDYTLGSWLDIAEHADIDRDQRGSF